MVQCLLRHGASWCEDGVGDLLCKAVGSFSSLSELMKFWKDVDFMCMCICIQAYKSLEKLRRVSDYSQVKLDLFVIPQT